MRFLIAGIAAVLVFFFGVIGAGELAEALSSTEEARVTLGLLFGMPVGMISFVTLITILEW